MVGKKLALVLLVIFLLALQLVACSKPLTLTVTQPMDGATVTESQIYVKGKVSSPKAAVTVNNASAWMGKTGEFQGTVYLVEGENTIRVVATLGKKEVTKTVTVTYAPSGPGVFRSDEFYLEVKLPTGWAAVDGPEYLAHPYEGQVAFNSWGQEDFWAREVRTEHSDNTTSYIYDPRTVMSQVPEGGVYVALVRIFGPPRLPDYNTAEYTLNDLSGLYQPHDWRQDSASDAQFIQFYKWERDLRLEIACHTDASDETVTELNDLLQSWRFDSVPAVR